MATRIEPGSIDAAYEAYRRIPEFAGAGYDRAEFERRLGDRSALTLIAFADATPIGFKVGYDRYHDGSWYSWLGGVVGERRRERVAEKLLECQERWVRARGYARIVVKTRNRFVGMRALLARSGYMVVAVEAPEANTPTDELRLIHVKVL